MENQYSVYVIFTKNQFSEAEIVDKLLTHSSKEGDLLFCRSCLNKEGEQVNRFICCLRKSFYDHLLQECGFSREGDFNVTKYRVNNDALLTGMTYGFYVKCSSEEEERIRGTFEKFQAAGFLREGTYNILKPSTYPNGDRRGYIIVTFERKEGKYPKQYIRKLRALLNNSEINGRRVHFNWVSHSVARDVANQESKERKVQNMK